MNKCPSKWIHTGEYEGKMPSLNLKGGFISCLIPEEREQQLPLGP